MSKISDFNEKLAAKITAGVATMWCAYAFAILTFISLPAAIKTHSVVTIVGWVAQTFLQLVLLSIIMVGQNAGSAAVEQKIDETHTASLGEFELAKEARELNNEEIKELKEIAREMHMLLKRLDAEKK
jgi:hypothetical protein